MTIYFYGNTLGFDVVDSSCIAPEGAVEISQAEYAGLFAGQGIGKVISVNENGFPVLVEPAGPTLEHIIATERSWRDAELITTDGLVARHRDELETSASTTLTDAEYIALQAYRCKLRSWPNSINFPENSKRPILKNSPVVRNAARKKKVINVSQVSESL